MGSSAQTQRDALANVQQAQRSLRLLGRPNGKRVGPRDHALSAYSEKSRLRSMPPWKLANSFRYGVGRNPGLRSARRIEKLRLRLHWRANADHAADPVE